jgi:hypothetical protein
MTAVGGRFNARTQRAQAERSAARHEGYYSTTTPMVEQPPD